MDALYAISPIDGRYKSQLEELSNYFSEAALIQFRIKVEIYYFIALSEQKLFSLTATQKKQLEKIAEHVTDKDIRAVKKIERTTNHDVKAVEYFLRKKFTQLKLTHLIEWIHFGLTSQDINNTAQPMLWQNAIMQCYLPQLSALILLLKKTITDVKGIAMLARTHGQAATPTTLSKELYVYIERLENQIIHLNHYPFYAKLGGATGNFNAHYITYPKVNWLKFADDFVEKKLHLTRLQFTTQIDHYDNLAAQFDWMKRINTILLDFCKDMWAYISMDYFKQISLKNEVGSSAMPHKVNPIDFENAEGNLGIANTLFIHLSEKLPISRLQRDLTDSTVLRNIGVPFAHTLLALKSIQKGLKKVVVNAPKINADLEQNWAVIAEAIQTILRREKIKNPYEMLKKLTRGNEITKETIHTFVNELPISLKIKKELLAITPHNYIGKNPAY